MSSVLDDIAEIQPSPDLLSVLESSALPTLLSLDIGTSGVRSALFDDSGNEVSGRSTRIDSVSTSLADAGVIDADVLVEQVAGAIDSLLADFHEHNSSIELIAVSCFWHSLVGVDATTHPTTRVFGWSDRQSTNAARQLKAEHDELQVHARTGSRFHPSYWPAKLRRIRDEEPTIFSSTRHWLSFADYLALKLFGETGTSVSMASGSGLLNQKTCEWDTELISALHLDIDQLPDIFSHGRTFSELSSNYAQRWPALRNARMFPAIGDGAANNIGVGCVSRDQVALMIGTSGAMRVVLEEIPPTNLPPELWCYRINRERIVLGGALSDGGSIYRWIHDSLLPSEDSEWIEAELMRMEPDAHGLTVLPFWSGERSTGWNADARGSIIGLNLETKPVEILRAVMEAVAYRFALIAQALEPFAPGGRIVASGQALQTSRVWPQILADVLGRPIHLLTRGEASTRGAALLALEAAGKITSIADFSNPVAAVFEPDSTRHGRYQKGLERHQHYYDIMIAENFKTKSGW